MSPGPMGCIGHSGRVRSYSLSSQVASHTRMRWSDPWSSRPLKESCQASGITMGCGTSTPQERRRSPAARPAGLNYTATSVEDEMAQPVAEYLLYRLVVCFVNEFPRFRLNCLDIYQTGTSSRRRIMRKGALPGLPFV